MSAFIVSTKTMQRAVTALVHVHDFSPKQADALGARLWRLNADAIRQRYPDCKEMLEDAAQTDRQAPSFFWRASRPRTRDAQCVVLKALFCLGYQCSEGDIDENTEPDYRLMAEAERALEAQIAPPDGDLDKLPAYANADWF
jgi:hypothetical protein